MVTGSNVGKLERDVRCIVNVARLLELGAPKVVINRYANGYASGHAKELIAAAKEYAEYSKDFQKSFGCHLNRISSGEMAYDVIHEDPETHEREFLGTYGSEEEAIEAETDENCYIINYDPNEWWAILDSEGRNRRKMLFHSRERAIVFMLEQATDSVPAWAKWSAISNQEGE